MGTHIDYTLNEDDLAAVTHAMQYDKRRGVSTRATAIHLLHLGHMPSKVAVMLGVERSTIHDWHHRFKQGGVEGLVDKAGRGRHRKATETYIAMLEEALSRSPADYGYGYSVWTVKRLAEHLEQVTGLLLSVRTLEGLLVHLGYVYKRPKYTLKHLQDPAAVALAEATLAELKRGPSDRTQRASPPMSSSLWTKQPAP
jgi:transposase